MRRAPVVFAVAITVGCGATVDPLDPHDESLPIETRRWIAAAEDGVIAARARLDSARGRLAATRGWSERLIDEVDLPRQGAELEETLERWAESRIRLAELEVDASSRGVDLAESNYELANAERAVLHDLARVDLEPLREASETAAEELSTARERVLDQRVKVERLTDQWWSGYRRFVEASGNTRSFWIGDAEPLRATAERSADEEDDEDD